jgi:uncharacterized protein (DUF427 family)
MIARWNNRIIARSDDTVLVEGNHYFPLMAVEAQYLRDSDHTTVCGWKGTAHYYSLEVDGQCNANAAWYYPQPSEAASAIAARVAFWKGVQVATV